MYSNLDFALLGDDSGSSESSFDDDPDQKAVSSSMAVRSSEICFLKILVASALPYAESGLITGLLILELLRSSGGGGGVCIMTLLCFPNFLVGGGEALFVGVLGSSS